MGTVPVRSRIAATLIALLVIVPVGAALAGCSGGESPISRGSTTTLGSDDVPQRDTSFYPDDPNRNLSDCIGSLERPGCGSKARGGWRMGLTFGILALALVFIGWRLVRAWRRRDHQMMATVGDSRWVKSNPPPRADHHDQGDRHDDA